MSSQASFLCSEDLNIIRFEPPTNVYASPVGPFGIGATPTFLRAAGAQFLSSERFTEPSTHGPPIQTASLPPLNWFSTCVPSRSSSDAEYSPSLIRSPRNVTPCLASGLLMVDFLLSSDSSAPPASHTNGITWWTRSNAFLPGEPNGSTPGTSCLIVCRVLRNESQSTTSTSTLTPVLSVNGLTAFSMSSCGLGPLGMIHSFTVAPFSILPPVA